MWNANVSFHSSNTLKWPKSHTRISWEWKANISSNILITVPKNRAHVHHGSGKFVFLSIPLIYYKTPKLHTCTSWKWKAHFFFPFLQYITMITMPKNHIHVLPRSGKLTFLSIPPIHYNAQKSHVSSTSWEWKANVSSNILITMPQNHIHVFPGNGS